MPVVVSFIGKWDGKDLERARAELLKMQKQTEDLAGRFSRIGSNMQDFGKKVGNVGGSLTKNLTLPIVAGGAALVAFAKGAEDAEIANRKLGAVLESMGYPEATDRVSAYAEQLERNLAVDADIIKATQTKLATFKNLTASVDEAGGAFDRATLAALDLAAAGFGSAETNAVQLGKALQDPVKGITALGRAGVTFTDQEKEKIKALVESGQLLEAQNIVLAAIETQVGGTAEAGASSFERLKLSLMQVADAIGMAVLPLINQLADFVANTLVPTIVPKIEQILDAFNNLDPGVKKALAAVVGFAAALGPVLMIAGKIITSLGAVVGVMNPLTLKIAAVVAVVAVVSLAFKTMWDRSEALRDAVSKLISTVQNIARVLIGDVLGAFRSITSASGDTRNILDRVAKVAGDVLAGALRVLTNWWTVLANGVRVAIKVFEVVFKTLGMVGNLIRGAVIAAIDILLNKLGPVSAALRSLANNVKSTFSNIASVVSAAFKNIGPAIEGVINFAIRAINKMIDAYNKLADVLPGVTRATHIAEFTFKDLSAGAERASYSANNLANNIGGYASQVLRGNQATEAGITAFNGLNVAAGDAALGIDDVGKSAGKAGGASEQAAAKLEKFKAKFNEVAERLKTARQEIEQQYKSMAQTVQNAILGSIDFADALPEFDEQGNRVGGTFMDKLNEQANRATEFAAKIKQLIAQDLSPEAITMVVQAGIDAGTKIANELINGGATAIDETNRLVESTTLAGQEVGLLAAETYYGTGLALAIKTEEGFQKRFGEGGPGFNKLNAMMSHLARSMERTTVITVVTRHVTEGVPGRRMGGPVAAGSPYIVGEAGPELFVPTVSGQIIPNHDLNTVSSGRGAGAVGGGGSVINISVNAGIGTDGAEVGRQVVNAIKQYERRNGAVYVPA